MRFRHLLLTGLVAAYLPGAALAGPDSYRHDDTRLHGALGLGGAVSLVGPARYGPALQLELYPGGRLGGRVDYRGAEELTPGQVTVGASYAVGSTRPHLHLALHGDLGATTVSADRRYLVGAGVQAQLWLIYPLAVGVDSSAQLAFGDGLPELALTGVATLRLSL